MPRIFEPQRARKLSSLIIICLLIFCSSLYLTKSKSKPHPSESRVVICGSARDVAEHLPRVFENGINPLKSFFKDYRIIIFENDSKDQTRTYLKELKKKDPKLIVLTEKKLEKRFKKRTERLAYARNQYMQYIHTHFPDFDYVIILDLDDHPVRDTPIKLKRLQQLFDKREEWDVVSIGRHYYYDIWALRSSQYPHNCSNLKKELNYIKESKRSINATLKKLNRSKFIEVESSFNGIAIYYLPKTKDCFYNGRNYEPVIRSNSDCEHVAFHRDMRTKHNARIVITPMRLF